MLRYGLLGIIQGFTEFFPVSSSGHLVILGRLCGLQGGELATVLILHLGTTLALLVFFFRDILNLLRSPKTVLFVLLANVVTGIIYKAGADFFESQFRAPRSAAVALLITGVVLILSKKFMQAKRERPNFKDALVLGLAQGLAIAPGISRSGLTISALLFRGLKRQESFRFSFLAAIPAILGACILKAKEISSFSGLAAADLTAGFIFSFLSGLLALRILKKVITEARLHYFGYYCLIAAILSLILLK
jgi:undecaprenyl-diphosphatase